MTIGFSTGIQTRCSRLTEKPFYNLLTGHNDDIRAFRDDPATQIKSPAVLYRAFIITIKPLDYGSLVHPPHPPPEVHDLVQTAFPFPEIANISSEFPSFATADTWVPCVRP
jgi:hypothetical protein